MKVYVYGLLDPGPKVIQGSIGTAWSVGSVVIGEGEYAAPIYEEQYGLSP